MSLLPHQLELLSPARDADIGIEAINHGADAVYIGGPAFGARASARQSTSGTLSAWCSTPTASTAASSSRSTPSCATMSWRPRASMAWQVYEAGADALIVQDMGLLEIDLPPIQLHASTQTDIRTPEKAKFLQDAGLQPDRAGARADGASRLPQCTRRWAGNHPAAPTSSFFIHGALCVAYSGQCNISHAHTGRSANRGDCCQACRLPYQVTDAQGQLHRARQARADA